MTSYQAQMQQEKANLEKYRKSLKGRLDWLIYKFIWLFLSPGKHFFPKKWRITHNRAGDYFYSLRSFCKKLKRLPRRDGSFNSYLFHLKASNEILNPLRQFISDKEHVKTYIKAKVGDKYNIPTIKILRSKEEIDNYEFPPKCCIKPTHSSGLHILRRNGEPIDKEEIKSWLDKNYYIDGRERNYKYLIPKIIVEPIIMENRIIGDFKVLCYKGVPKYVCLPMFEDGVKVGVPHYDCEWNEIGCSVGVPIISDIKVEKPKNLSEILDIATKLCEDFESVRVDFYVHNDEILVGELTNCQINAINLFYPEEAEYVISKLYFNENNLY